jgi:hypothetical protein
VAWNFHGHARHRGIVLLMLISVVWMARAHDARAPRHWLWSAILIVNAVTGLTTLSSELSRGS